MCWAWVLELSHGLNVICCTLAVDAQGCSQAHLQHCGVQPHDSSVLLPGRLVDPVGESPHLCSQSTLSTLWLDFLGCFGLGGLILVRQIIYHQTVIPALNSSLGNKMEI